MLRIAIASLLLLTGCASTPVPDNRDAATKVSDGVGEATGKVATGIVRGIVEFVPGLESAINGVDKQLQNRQNRAQKRAQAKLEDETDSKLFEFCTSNPCQSACREHLIKEIGVAPDCNNETTYVQPNVKPTFNPAYHTPIKPTENPESTIVEHEGLRTSEYEVEGKRHIGVGSRVWEDTELKTSDDIVERFASDLDHAESVAIEYAGDLAWRRATEKQRLALIEIAFALGRTGMNKFAKMRQYIQAVEWKAAARELENSAWFNSDRERVQTLANNLKSER